MLPGRYLARAALLPLFVVSACALAYRPFDGTDADVAELKEIEIEFGPVQYLREGTDRTLVSPAAVFNMGIAEGWEAVLQAERDRPLGDDAPPASIGGAGAFLKTVLREGSLQNKPGLSIATEFGVLLPDSRGDHGTGASLAGIVSQKWTSLVAHFNVAAELTQEHHGDIFVGTIFEGPQRSVRPVAEIFYEHDTGGITTTSGLIGAIWQWNDDLSFDVGIRRARMGGLDVDEFRAGLTWSFTP
jgi:hypothetical protein